jgi:hypothetical protein
MNVIPEPDHSAILIWFPRGRVPKDVDFAPSDTDPSIEPFWFRYEAVSTAIEVAINGGSPTNRDARIKAGSTLLDLPTILREYGQARGATDAQGS